MTTAAAPTDRRRALRDLPVGLKIATAVGSIALVALLLSVLSVVRLTQLAATSHDLYEDTVRPLGLLTEIQRTFQGDRARHLQYAPADAEGRATLLEELETRRADLDGLLEDYAPLASTEDRMTDLVAKLDDYYTTAQEEVLPAADSGDMGLYSTLANDLRTEQTTGVLDVMKAESDAHLAEADVAAAASQASAARPCGSSSSAWRWACSPRSA